MVYRVKIILVLGGNWMSGAVSAGVVGAILLVSIPSLRDVQWGHWQRMKCERPTSNFERPTSKYRTETILSLLRSWTLDVRSSIFFNLLTSAQKRTSGGVAPVHLRKCATARKPLNSGGNFAKQFVFKCKVISALQRIGLYLYPQMVSIIGLLVSGN